MKITSSGCTFFPSTQFYFKKHCFCFLLFCPMSHLLASYGAGTISLLHTVAFQFDLLHEHLLTKSLDKTLTAMSPVKDLALIVINGLVLQFFLHLLDFSLKILLFHHLWFCFVFFNFFDFSSSFPRLVGFSSSNIVQVAFFLCSFQLRPSARSVVLALIDLAQFSCEKALNKRHNNLKNENGNNLTWKTKS